MAKDTPKTGRQTTSRVRFSTGGSRWRDRLAQIADHNTLGWGLLACALFVIVVGSLTAWTRQQPLIAVGQIMRETRLARIEFNTEDLQQTENLRERARQDTPRVYAADLPVLEELRASIANLPITVSGVDALDAVDRDIRVRFGLSEERLAAVKAISSDETLLAAWDEQVSTLDDMLRGRPLLDAQAWQRATQEGLSTQIQLRQAPIEESGEVELKSRDAAVNIGNSEALETEVAALVRIAGFDESVREVVAARLLHEPRPTFVFDASATSAAAEQSAEQVRPVRQVIAAGQKIYSRGDVLDQSQLALALEERSQYGQRGSTGRLVARNAGVFGLIGAITVLLAGYIATFCPRIATRPARIGWLTTLLAAAIGSACLLGASDPALIWLTVLTPVVLVTVLLCIAYDQRTALAIGAVLAIFLALALRLQIGMVAVMLVGIAAAVSQLRDIRERRTLTQMSIAVAVALCGAAMLDQIIQLPAAALATGVRMNAIVMAGLQSLFAGLLAGGIALFILPFVEKAFDITTGMTLIELRDPKQPLLRELQQRAPGTYNHSLNVASIAESAADAIGADALLTYVGCLYHDIGKMNKPGYFVENQQGGPNKHDKLNPAMSLLVIVGHVKDGLEIARRAGLPRNLRHFIEAHHGTTLVEYFYRRALQKAEKGDEQQPIAERSEDEERLPEEFTYRYPGPRPNTKEVAITMLADAVESATRTLAEPTPARIDGLVRELANRRLMDGQFDNCDLTLRELSKICDSISKTVASIYHGRVRYASTAEEEKPEEGEQAVKDEHEKRA